MAYRALDRKCVHVNRFYLYILALFLFVHGLCGVDLQGAKTFMLDYSESVEVRSDFYDFSIVHYDAELILPRHKKGKLIASVRYKRLVDRWTEEQKKAPEKILFDLSEPVVVSWLMGIFSEIKNSPYSYDGVFLDWAMVDEESQDYETIFLGLRELWQSVYLLQSISAIQNEYLSDRVDGVVVKGWSNRNDFKQSSSLDRSDTGNSEMAETLERYREKGKEIFIVAFPQDKSNRLEVDEIYHAIVGKKYNAFVTDQALQGEDLYFSPQKRVILSLYGRRPRVGGFLWAEDTDVQNILSIPFEWRGYEMDHHSVLEDGVPTIASDISAIIIDNATIIKGNNELPFLKLIDEAVQRGVKVYCLGSLPVMSSSAFANFLDLLGLEGNQAFYFPKEEIKYRGDFSSIPSFEIDFRVKTNTGLPFVYSLENSPVIFEGESTDGKLFQHSPIVFSPKVALWQAPHVSILDTDDNSLLMADPYWFVDQSLDEELLLVPDSTTLYGARIFFSQIDGDGLLNFSQIKAGARSGEVIRDDVLKKFPFPVSSSIIVSEVEGDTVVYKERFENEFKDLAISIYDLDNIEVSSHTYSHPYFWSYEDVEMSLFYDSRHLKLKRPYEFDAIKETIGSLDYISELIDHKKEAKLMLWSGNCRPPADLLQTLNRKGYYNINGGNTTISKRYPYHTHISPKSIFWRGGFQVYAAIQNENVFNNEFGNNRFAGFINVLDTFRMTESPRRLKPIDLYYHFYSADRTDSFVALIRILEALRKMEIYPIFGSEFYKIVEDSYFMSLAKIGENRYFSNSNGYVRTYRIPVDKGLYPDFSRSKDLVGYSDYQGQRYIYTDGSANPEIALRKQAPTELYLEYADVTLEKIELGEESIQIQTGPLWVDSSKLKFRMSGAEQLFYQIDGNEPQVVVKDADGIFQINDVPGNIQLKVWAKTNIK